MSFIWPQALLLLLLVPAGVLLYRWIGDRQRRRAQTLGGLGMLERTGYRPGRVRGQLPAVLFVLGFIVLCVALARPQGSVDLPSQEGTVVLAFDVSGSMAADDLKPTRMAAAKAAATDFVQKQPEGVLIGVVAFSDAGVSVQTPTKDQDAVLGAINRLAPQKGTSVAGGISASLDAIDQVINPPPTDFYTNRTPAPDPTPTPTPVPAGTYAPAVIVLLSDGENNEQPDPATVAQVAADRGVRIDTVGIGSVSGVTLDLNGFKVHSQLHEEVLQQIAQMTNGVYYSASDEQNLKQVYDNLNTQLVVRSQTIELTALFAGAGIVLLVAGGLLSLAWLGRLP